MDYYGFEKSLAAFNDECNRKGKSIVNVERHNNNNNSNGSGGNSTTSLQKSSVINVIKKQIDLVYSINSKLISLLLWLLCCAHRTR